MFEDRSRNELIVMGLIALVLFAALIENAPQLFILLTIAGMVYYHRNREEQRRDNDRPIEDWEIEREEPRPRPIRRERPSNAEQIHQHALKAVRGAGLNPTEIQALPVDLGLIAFSKDGPSSIHRTADVPDDCDYIQPFMELRVPVNATGKVRFEIFDANRRSVFVHEDYHELKRGRNLISPGARLPVHDELEMDGRWEMRVTADGMVLARHIFQWADTDNEEENGIRDHIIEDGEISNELRAIMAESRLQRMSLDELLDFQDDDGAAQQQR